MGERNLILGGSIGAALAAICCATPILAIAVTAFGFSAWLAWADYVLIPLLLASAGMIVLGLHRRRTAKTACHRTAGAATPGHTS